MILRCENLVKKYGVRTVVKGVSMQVSQGEIVGFLGPNGAGKTTSFYMITGQIVPNARGHRGPEGHHDHRGADGPDGIGLVNR